VAPEHVSESLIRDVMAEIGERARDPVVAPSSIPLGHEDDQRFDVNSNTRSSRIGAMLGSVELEGDETAVPAKYGLGFGDTRDLGEQLAAVAFANVGERAPLAIGAAHVSGEAPPQDTILCDQVFALEE
jgi:hypothetical protein